MIPFRRILFATDLSTLAGSAQRYACDLAERFQAELHVLSVIQDVSYVTSDPNSPWIIPASTLAEIQHAVEDAVAQIPPADWSATRSVVRTVVSGVPFLEIIRYAAERQIDLIVIGTHGRTGLTHMLIGSTAEKVVRKSPCPVLVIPPGHGPGPDAS